MSYEHSQPKIVPFRKRTLSSHWYWTPGESYSMQHLCFPDCYYLSIRVGTHFTVVPSRQVVREKVVWGGLPRCWRVMRRIFPLRDEVPFCSHSQSFLLFSPHTSEVSLWFFFSFLASLIYPVKWAKDNMKIRSLYIWGPFPHQCFDPPWLHICTILTNAVIQIVEL